MASRIRNQYPEMEHLEGKSPKIRIPSIDSPIMTPDLQRQSRPRVSLPHISELTSKMPSQDLNKTILKDQFITYVPVMWQQNGTHIMGTPVVRQQLPIPPQIDTDLTLKFARSASVSKRVSNSRASATADYRCEVDDCGKSFPSRSRLQRHAAVHSGEKPFLCLFKHCGRHFGRRDNMLQHYRTHVVRVPQGRNN
jgi:uncharacterized Zn-finger protein